MQFQDIFSVIVLFSGKNVLLITEKGSTLINIGRGNIISDGDLVHALEMGWIREAVLDVFREEPLAEEHVFWKHPK